MQKISSITATATPDGLFTNGSVATGVSPTNLEAEWFNTIQTELVTLVTSAGLALDPTDNTQVFAALKKMFLIRSNPFSDLASDGAANITKALLNLGISVQQSGNGPLILQVGKFILQAGIASGTTTAEGNLNVPFPVSFPNAVMYYHVTQANQSYATDTTPYIFSPYPSPSGPVTQLGSAVRNTKTGAYLGSSYINARFIAIGF